MEDVWARIASSGVRNFDAPGRWLMYPGSGRGEFAEALLVAVAETAAWAAMGTGDLDDPGDRARVMGCLAAVEQLLSTLRLGVAEALARAASES